MINNSIIQHFLYENGFECVDIDSFLHSTTGIIIIRVTTKTGKVFFREKYSKKIINSIDQILLLLKQVSL